MAPHNFTPVLDSISWECKDSARLPVELLRSLPLELLHTTVAAGCVLFRKPLPEHWVMLFSLPLQRDMFH